MKFFKTLSLTFAYLSFTAGASATTIVVAENEDCIINSVGIYTCVWKNIEEQIIGTATAHFNLINQLVPQRIRGYVFTDDFIFPVFSIHVYDLSGVAQKSGAVSASAPYQVRYFPRSDNPLRVGGSVSAQAANNSKKIFGHSYFSGNFDNIIYFYDFHDLQNARMFSVFNTNVANFPDEGVWSGRLSWSMSDNLLTSVSAWGNVRVPEPATWGLMLAGFGLVGWRIRGRLVRIPSCKGRGGLRHRFNSGD